MHGTIRKLYCGNRVILLVVLLVFVVAGVLLIAFWKLNLNQNHCSTPAGLYSNNDIDGNAAPNVNDNLNRLSEKCHRSSTVPAAGPSDSMTSSTAN